MILNYGFIQQILIDQIQRVLLGLYKEIIGDRGFMVVMMLQKELYIILKCIWEKVVVATTVFFIGTQQVLRLLPDLDIQGETIESNGLDLPVQWKILVIWMEQLKILVKAVTHPGRRAVFLTYLVVIYLMRVMTQPMEILPYGLQREKRLKLTLLLYLVAEVAARALLQIH